MSKGPKLASLPVGTRFQVRSLFGTVMHDGIIGHPGDGVSYVTLYEDEGKFQYYMHTIQQEVDERNLVVVIL